MLICFQHKKWNSLQQINFLNQSNTSYILDLNIILGLMFANNDQLPNAPNLPQSPFLILALKVDKPLFWSLLELPVATHKLSGNNTIDHMVVPFIHFSFDLSTADISEIVLKLSLV